MMLPLDDVPPQLRGLLIELSPEERALAAELISLLARGQQRAADPSPELRGLLVALKHHLTRKYLDGSLAPEQRAALDECLPEVQAFGGLYRNLVASCVASGYCPPTAEWFLAVFEDGALLPKGSPVGAQLASIMKHLITCVLGAQDLVGLDEEKVLTAFDSADAVCLPIQVETLAEVVPMLPELGRRFTEHFRARVEARRRAATAAQAGRHRNGHEPRRPVATPRQGHGARAPGDGGGDDDGGDGSGDPPPPPRVAPSAPRLSRPEPLSSLVPVVLSRIARRAGAPKWIWMFLKVIHSRARDRGVDTRCRP